jgi:hypothetical protein
VLAPDQTVERNAPGKRADAWGEWDGDQRKAQVDERDNPIHREAVRHLGVVRETLERWAEQAGAHNPVEMSYQLQILMMGAIVSATSGELEAARRARVFAQLLPQSSR